MANISRSVSSPQIIVRLKEPASPIVTTLTNSFSSSDGMNGRISRLDQEIANLNGEIQRMAASINCIEKMQKEIDTLKSQMASLKPKVDFLLNYLTVSPGDCFYYCKVGCAKWRSIFLSEQIKRIITTDSVYFNLFCPRCNIPSRSGPNSDAKALVARLVKEKILMHIPSDAKASQ